MVTAFTTDAIPILTAILQLNPISPLHTYIHTYIHTQPFYGSVDFVRDNPGEPVPEDTFCHLLDFLEQMKITQADAPTIWMDCHPIQTNWCPPSLPSAPFLCRMPFLTQPSQFILAWNRHQICWLAYLVAWLHTYIHIWNL